MGFVMKRFKYWMAAREGFWTLAILSSLFTFTGAGCVTRHHNATPKIIGGSLVEENDSIYKSAVSLDAGGEPVCTGFLFDKRTVVTAAHCLASQKLKGGFSLTFGSRNRALVKSVFVSNRQFVLNGIWDPSDLRRSDIDPLPQKPKGDIGVIVLSEDAPDWTRPLPVKEIGDIAIGRDVILAGYGETRAQAQDLQTTEFKGFLRKAKVKLSVINSAGQELIYESPADNRRANSCHGDSGGPMYFVEDDGSLTVIGVTSRSYAANLDCQEKGVYTDVRKYTDWIRTNAEKMRSKMISTADWHHRYFESKNGTKMVLDYTLTQEGEEYLANQVWLNVYNPAFNGQEKIEATLTSYINSLSQQKLKMGYAGEHRFTIKFDQFQGKKVCALASRWGVQQDVILEIDGKQILNNVSGDEKFKFKFCEQGG